MSEKKGLMKFFRPTFPSLTSKITLLSKRRAYNKDNSSSDASSTPTRPLTHSWKASTNAISTKKSKKKLLTWFYMTLSMTTFQPKKSLYREDGEEKDSLAVNFYKECLISSLIT